MRYERYVHVIAFVLAKHDLTTLSYLNTFHRRCPFFRQYYFLNICPFQRREAEGRVGAHKNLFVQPR